MMTNRGYAYPGTRRTEETHMDERPASSQRPRNIWKAIRLGGAILFVPAAIALAYGLWLGDGFIISVATVIFVLGLIGFLAGVVGALSLRKD